MDQVLNLLQEIVRHLLRARRVRDVLVRHEEVDPDLRHGLEAQDVAAVERLAHAGEAGQHALRVVGQEEGGRELGLRFGDERVGGLQHFAVGDGVAVGNAVPAVLSALLAGIHCDLGVLWRYVLAQRSGRGAQGENVVERTVGRGDDNFTRQIGESIKVFGCAGWLRIAEEEGRC